MEYAHKLIMVAQRHLRYAQLRPAYITHRQTLPQSGLQLDMRYSVGQKYQID